ncbi:hypothetical protein ACFPM7_02660 [Actinokineospora guangxiensis]|uniref:Uncharacterized protein n=1 Tax=Actinokineospora guangxiensis TaxID=1490288 RepID=A0ABW0EI86_9PSEU
MTTDEPPIMPTADEAGERVRPPMVVTVAYWLWLVAGAIGLAGGLTVLLNQQFLADSYATTQSVPLTEAMDIVKGYTVWLILGSAVFLLLYWLLAYQARNGVRKARMLLIVVGLLSAFFQYGFGRITIFGLICAMATIIALALLFMPGAKRFYDAHGR